MLAAKDAAERWNGDKTEDVSVAFRPEEWTLVTERMGKLGFGHLAEYVESLIEMDVSGNAFEAIVSKEMGPGKSSNVPLSRIADRTGLAPRLVLQIQSELEEQRGSANRHR